jgi:hypothetical protein
MKSRAVAGVGAGTLPPASLLVPSVRKYRSHSLDTVFCPELITGDLVGG